MSTRFLNSLALTLTAGVLVVFTMAFPATTVAWLTFALAIAATVLTLGMQLTRPTLTHRILGGLGSVVSVWTIIASLVFAPTTVLWLGFAGAIALVSLGVGGLLAHEVTTERVVHSLQVEERPAERELSAA